MGTGAYLMAYGLGMTLGNDPDRAHLFARNYTDVDHRGIQVEALIAAWNAFQARGKELGLVK